MARMPARSTRWVAALFVALALVGTYPIARAPTSYAYFDHADAQLNMWIMAWDAHALRHDPLNLFNANLFSPEPRTLAYSETLLGYLPLFGPILWLGGSPALAFNIVLLFSFAASGFAMYLLARHLTGRHFPGIVGGIMYAFVPYRFVHIPQIQLEAMEWFPIALLCLHLFVERGQWRYAIGVGACLVEETLCCVYYGIFLTIALAVGSVVLVTLDRRGREWRTLATLALVTCVAAMVVAPVAGEYLHVHRQLHLERAIAEISSKSATPATYLSSTAPLHLWLWAAAVPPPRDYLFPGMAALFLAAIGVGAAVKKRHKAPVHVDRRLVVCMYGAVAAIGLLASFGPAGVAGLSPYRFLYSAVPIFHGLRQVTRFGVLAIFGVSVLAAIGATVVDMRLRPQLAVQAACVGVIFLELCGAPLRRDRPGGVDLVHVPSTPPEYVWLAQQPGRFAILELPYAYEGQLWENASYVYWSTIHWHGLVDAYSGFAPPNYASLARILANFPDTLSREALEIRHVRYVVIHRDRYRRWNPAVNFARLNRTVWLERAATFPNVDVFEVRADDRAMSHVDRGW